MAPASQDTDVIRLISEPRRRDILGLIWSEELSAGEIASHFEVTFGAISQHLRILANARLVTVRQRGRFRLYRANRQALSPLERQMVTLWADRLRAVKATAEGASARKKRP